MHKGKKIGDDTKVNDRNVLVIVVQEPQPQDDLISKDALSCVVCWPFCKKRLELVKYSNYQVVMLLAAKLRLLIASACDSHALTQVYTRLHKLNLCASHRDTLSTLDILGKGYDTKMMKWSNALTSRINSNNNVCLCLTFSASL